MRNYIIDFCDGCVALLSFLQMIFNIISGNWALVFAHLLILILIIRIFLYRRDE